MQRRFRFAIAKRAEETGEKLDLTIMTGASVGDQIDGALTRAGAMKKRLPYQTNSTVRNAINAGEIEYFDMHLSQLPFGPKMDFRRHRFCNRRSFRYRRGRAHHSLDLNRRGKYLY